MSDADKVIGTSAIIAVTTGTLNSIYQEKGLPSSRFLIGMGATYLILSAMATAAPELAKAFAIAVATTVVLGEGGGVLAHLSPKGEIDTHKTPKDNKQDDDRISGTVATETRDTPKRFHTGTSRATYEGLAPYPGL